MKQIRLTTKNENEVVRLVKDSNLNLLTVSNVSNMAIEKGLPIVRKLVVKPKKP